MLIDTRANEPLFNIRDENLNIKKAVSIIKREEAEYC